MKPRPFAAVLSDLLAEREMSAHALSRHVELGPSALYNILHGRSVPTIETTEKIARVLEVAPTVFAEYRLMKAADALDWRRHGLAKAMRELGERSSPPARRPRG